MLSSYDIGRRWRSRTYVLNLKNPLCRFIRECWCTSTGKNTRRESRNRWICVWNRVKYYPIDWICGKYLQVSHECTAFRPRMTSLLSVVSMYPEKGMIAVDMDPIMWPWSIRDRCIWIWNQKRDKPDHESENNGTNAGATFVEQVKWNSRFQSGLLPGVYVVSYP